MHLLLWLVVGSLVVASATAQQTVQFGGPFVVGELKKGAVDEASGIAASRKHEGLLWIHNDSGDGAFVYGLSLKGAVQCTIKLEGAHNADWEDIAVGPGPDKGTSYIYAGDIGDNAAQRTNITIYRFAEPADASGNINVAADALIFTYPDGARDAEALMVDPATQDIYIVTKREKRSRIYVAKAPHNTGTSRALTFVGELKNPLIVGGDISPKGDEILLKDYVYAYYWQRKSNETIVQALKREPTKVAYMPEPQGEAICFSAKGDGYYTISERPDTMWATNLYFFGRARNTAEADQLKDAKRLSMSLTPSNDTEGIYDLRYVVPEFANIRITVHNAAMMKIEDVELNASEGGVQEREIDMIDKPAGTYVVVLRAGSAYAAQVLEHK